MRRNIEIKAKCDDLNSVKAVALKLGAISHGLLEQTDTYFQVQHGRLKIRQQTGQPAQLIWYNRPNISTARGSDYQLVEITDPASLIDVLAKSLELRGQVRKTRQLLIWKNVRIHLDRIERLGWEPLWNWKLSLTLIIWNLNPANISTHCAKRLNSTPVI